MEYIRYVHAKVYVDTVIGDFELATIGSHCLKFTDGNVGRSNPLQKKLIPGWNIDKSLTNARDKIMLSMRKTAIRRVQQKNLPIHLGRDPYLTSIKCHIGMKLLTLVHRFPCVSYRYFFKV